MYKGLATFCVFLSCVLVLNLTGLFYLMNSPARLPLAERPDIVYQDENGQRRVVTAETLNPVEVQAFISAEAERQDRYASRLFFVMATVAIGDVILMLAAYKLRDQSGDTSPAPQPSQRLVGGRVFGGHAALTE